MSEWQPIVTAPKDRRIRVKGGMGPYGVTSWKGHAVWGRPENWHKDRSTWLSPDGAVLWLAGYRPTHWAPTTGQEGE